MSERTQTQVKKLLAALNTADDEVGAAEGADKPKRADAAERKYLRLSEQWRDLVDDVHAKPPKSWADIVARAEIASFALDANLRNAPPEAWTWMMTDRWYDERSFVQLVLAVLWLERKGGANA